VVLPQECARGFHVKCMAEGFRPVGGEEAEDDAWCCPLCISVAECLDGINEEFGTDFSNAVDVFPPDAGCVCVPRSLPTRAAAL
jgi:hypothetical protein